MGFAAQNHLFPRKKKVLCQKPTFPSNKMVLVNKTDVFVGKTGVRMKHNFSQERLFWAEN